MAGVVPARIAWAVEVLAVKAGDSILEIGCGRGVAVECIAAKLGSGTITAIDRSPTAVAAAQTRNRAAIREGKALFVRSPLADFEADRPFNKIFAVNVNAFWLSPTKELARLRNLRAPRGKLYLFYEPPGGQLARIEKDCAQQLEAGGFHVEKVLHRDLAASRGICFIAN